MTDTTTAPTAEALDDDLAERLAKAIAEEGIGRPWPDDFHEVAVDDIDQSGVRVYARACLPVIAAAIRQHSAPLEAQIAELTATLAGNAIELKAANTKIDRLRKAAEGSDQWANDVIAAICKHVGDDDADDGFTAADLASLLDEHNAEFDAISARATTAEAALSDLLRLTGAQSAEKAVAVVATMIAGADVGSYGSVVRQYADCKAALSAMTAERDKLREALTIGGKWGVAAPCWDGAVAGGLRDWIAAGCNGPLPQVVIETLAIIDPELSAALQTKEAGNVR